METPVFPCFTRSWPFMPHYLTRAIAIYSLINQSNNWLVSQGKRNKMRKGTNYVFSILGVTLYAQPIRSLDSSSLFRDFSYDRFRCSFYDSAISMTNWKFWFQSAIFLGVFFGFFFGFLFFVSFFFF